MTERAILIWEFDDAPPELRALSKHGGDEDAVVMLPAGMSEPPFWLEQLWHFSFIEKHEYEGRVVYIWAHA